MISRVQHLKNILKNVEKNILQMFGFRPRGTMHAAIYIVIAIKNQKASSFASELKDFEKELALAYSHEKQLYPNKLTIKDIVGDGILLAVPKFRRTVEKRWKRKFGSPDYVWKMLVPKTNIIVCTDCGHYHERGYICGQCYKKVEAETKEIQEKIQEKLGNQKPIENDVIVLYNGENLPEQPKEFWQGKRIIEMKKERPQWFSKNLLQKTTQQPSESKDVKPTDLA